MGEKFVDGILHYRWPIIIAGILFAFFCHLGKAKLGFTDDYRMFFSKDNPRVLAYDKIQKTYDKTDNVIMVVESDKNDIFNAETLTALHDITQKAWQLPFSARVESLTNFQHSYADANGLVVESLFDGERPPTAAELVQIKSIALEEPQIRNRLVATDGQVAAIHIAFRLPGEAINESALITTAVRKLAAEFEGAAGIGHIYMSGSILLNTAFGEESQKDATRLIPVMYAVIILSVGLLLRSPIGIAAALALITICTIVTTGMMGWLGILMTPPSAIAPTIILTIAVADAVHILAGFLKRRRLGLPKAQALREGLKANLFAVTLTSVTTAIGFLNLNFSEAPPYRDLGNVVAIGVISAYLYSILWLPAVISVLPFGNRPLSTGAGAERPADTGVPVQPATPLLHFVQWILDRPGATLATIGTLSLALVCLIPMNRINDAYVEYFSTDTRFRQDTDAIAEKLTGVYSIELDIRSRNGTAVSNPEFLAQLDAFVSWAREQPSMVHVASLTDVMKRLNRNLHGDDPAWYRLPQDEKFSPQALLLYEMSLPYGLDLNNQVAQDKTGTRVILTLKNLGTEDIIRFEKSIDAWIGANTPDLQSFAGSPTLMFSYISEQNVKSMLIGTFLSLAIISLLIGLTFKSWKYAAIAVATNFLPISVAFGIWGLCVGEVGLSVSIVSGISLGIVVDDTIHLLSKYNEGKKINGLPTTQAVLFAFQQTGGALIITSLVLIAGFGVMAWSSFLLNSSMGILTAITLFLAIVLDFTLMPALLKLFDGEKIDEKDADPLRTGVLAGH